MKKHDHRGFIVSLFRAVAGAVAVMIAVPASLATANPIEVENQLPGTTNWSVLTGQVEVKDKNGLPIKAYASDFSVNQGQSIEFFVAATPGQSYRIEIYRMGYYAGLGGRAMRTINGLVGEAEDPCTLQTYEGKITCDWSLGHELDIPTNWTTGIYLAKFVQANTFVYYLPFVVRNDARVPALVYHQPVTTYHAYNSFPNDPLGNPPGKSAYAGPRSHGPITPVFNGHLPDSNPTTNRAGVMSFDRPYQDGGAELYFRYEHDSVMFLEEHGYDVGYLTNLDVHTKPWLLRRTNVRGVISGGHDEYWTKEIFDAFEAARDAGKHLAFIGANAAFWQVRFSADGGVANRVMAIYKNFGADPASRLDKAITFRELGRAEQQLVGVQYVGFVDGVPSTPFIAQVNGGNPHWIFNGTGLSQGSSVSGVIGAEIDVRFYPNYDGLNFPQPDLSNYTTLGRSPYPVVDYKGTRRTISAEASIYEAASGAWVFASGTLRWNRALSPVSTDRRDSIRKMTTNLLDRFVGNVPTPDPEFRIADATATEGDGTAQVTVTLTPAVTQPRNVSLATQPGSAINGQDFVGTYQILSFSPGMTSRTANITLIDDNVPEGTEAFNVRLFNGGVVPIARNTGVVTITDNDTTVGSFSMQSMPVNEGAGFARVGVTLSSPATVPVSVDVSTSRTVSNSATPGADFYGRHGTLNYNPGEVYKFMDVTILNDTTVESNETIKLRLFNPQGGATVATPERVLTIIDND